MSLVQIQHLIKRQTDLRKAALKMISKLKWKKVLRKYEHDPVKFTLRVETLYGLCEKMDEDPGTTPMLTPCQRKETLVDAFPKDFRLTYDLRGGDYVESFAEIGQIMEDRFDRERESSSSSSDSESSGNSKANSSSSNNSDSSSSGRKKKNSFKKHENKKSNSKKKNKKPKKTPTKATKTKVKHPGLKEEYPIHGKHT